MPTHVRRSKNEAFFARDRRTDGPNEWHNDVVLWSLAGLTEDLILAALEYFGIGDLTVHGELQELFTKLDWLDNLVIRCKKSPGRSFDIEKGVGSRLANHQKVPPSGYAEPTVRMPFYSPFSGCLIAAASALIKEGGGEELSAAKLSECNIHFNNLAGLQNYLQSVARISWTSNHVTALEKKGPPAILEALLKKKGMPGLFLVRLSAHGSLSKHVIGVDTGKCLIWDSSETFALKLSGENLEYCCGNSTKIRGIEEIRELVKQMDMKRRARGESNKRRKKCRKFFK